MTFTNAINLVGETCLLPSYYVKASIEITVFLFNFPLLLHFTSVFSIIPTLSSVYIRVLHIRHHHHEQVITLEQAAFGWIFPHDLSFQSQLNCVVCVNIFLRINVRSKQQCMDNNL